jgi:hypothetical protein
VTCIRLLRLVIASRENETRQTGSDLSLISSWSQDGRCRDGSEEDDRAEEDRAQARNTQEGHCAEANGAQDSGEVRLRTEAYGA